MQERRLQDSLNDLLGRFGVERAGVIDAVIASAEEILQERGHAAAVVGLRHGELRVEAAGAAAKMLQWDADQILGELTKRHPGLVDRIIVARPSKRR